MITVAENVNRFDWRYCLTFKRIQLKSNDDKEQTHVTGWPIFKFIFPFSLGALRHLLFVCFVFAGEAYSWNCQTSLAPRTVSPLTSLWRMKDLAKT